MWIVSGVLQLMYELMDGQVRYTLQNMGTHTHTLLNASKYLLILSQVPQSQLLVVFTRGYYVYNVLVRSRTRVKAKQLLAFVSFLNISLRVKARRPGRNESKYF